VIWLILGLAPFVIVAIIALIDDPAVVLAVGGFAGAICGFLVLALYGAWEMNWIEHCGNTFWEITKCR
jgi:hypothetical protein